MWTIEVRQKMEWTINTFDCDTYFWLYNNYQQWYNNKALNRSKLIIKKVNKS